MHIQLHVNIHSHHNMYIAIYAHVYTEICIYTYNLCKRNAINLKCNYFYKINMLVNAVIMNTYIASYVPYNEQLPYVIYMDSEPANPLASQAACCLPGCPTCSKTDFMQQRLSICYHIIIICLIF